MAASVLLAGLPDRLLGQEPPDPLDEKIQSLIEQLGDEKYSARTRAEEGLAELGFEAFDALTDAATHEDLEIATRAKYLLALIQARWSAANEPAEVRRYLTYYQSQSRDYRMFALRSLARMPGWIGLPALCRLVRSEKSARWSKEAAIAVLHSEPVDDPGRARWGKVLRGHLGRNGRPAAEWLRAHLRFRNNPKTPLTKWARLVDDEQTLFQKSPGQSGLEIVRSLSYQLAMAQADQGDEELARATAAEARQLSGTTAPRRDSGLRAALLLQHRGRIRWADLDFRHVIDVGTTEQKVSAQILLAEMWHDQRDHLAAANALEQTVRIEKEELEPILTAQERTVGNVRARMGYFHASHWLEKGDHTRYRHYLDEAVKHDPADLDVLIARYHLPDVSDEYHQQTVQWIREAANGLRQEISRSPGDPSDYNQLAWLVGNTEGDQDEALRSAQRALQLQPDTGAYLDTLAHVYFGRGDLENAVKHQTEAARVSPYSGLIAQKLDLFRNELEESRKKEK